MVPRAASAAALAALALAVPLASATQQAFPGKAGKLVFQSNRGGDYELYTATANGSGVRKLLSRPQTDEFNASWSPNGRRIVFQSGPRGGSNFDLWLVESGGKGAHPILAGTTNDRAPQFCDHDTIVFTRQLSPTSSDVYSLDLGRKRVKRLTSDPGTDSFPTCNPKGDRIAFISGREGPPRIYEMNLDGTSQRPIVPAPSLDPDYSADGRHVAYVAPDAEGSLDVFVRDLASGAVVQRTNAKPPFEFRLPKFVPRAGAQRASSRIGGTDDPIVATQRDTSTTPAKEAVYELVTGATRPLDEPASGGSVQPSPAGQCRCQNIDAELWRTNLIKAGSDRNIFLTVMTEVECTKGSGGCHGTVEPVAPRVFRYSSGAQTIDCPGDCAGSRKNDHPFTLTSSNPSAGESAVVLELRFMCEVRRTKKRYTLAFKASGTIDESRSDLDGNGVLDYKEKRSLERLTE